MIEQALGFKEQQLLHAQGDAAGFLLRLRAYRSAPELTRFRLQVEAIEATLPGLPKFVTPDAKDIQDFDMWLLQPVGPSTGSIAWNSLPDIEPKLRATSARGAAARALLLFVVLPALLVWLLLASLFTVDVTEYGAGHPLRAAGARGGRAGPAPQGAVRPGDRTGSALDVLAARASRVSDGGQAQRHDRERCHLAHRRPRALSRDAWRAGPMPTCGWPTRCWARSAPSSARSRSSALIAPDGNPERFEAIAVADSRARRQLCPLGPGHRGRRGAAPAPDACRSRTARRSSSA